MTDLVTIVIPSHDLPDEVLRECLASIASQTFAGWRAVVVDDGSTHGDARRVVRRMADDRFHCIVLPENKGPSVARNVGFAGASTDLFLPVDGDDRLAPTFLARTTQALSEKAADCVFTDFLVFGEREAYRHHRVLGPQEMARTQWIPGPGVLMRRELFEQVGGYDESMRDGIEDRDFWLSATELGFAARHLAEPLYEKRYRTLSHGHGGGRSRRHLANRYVYAKHRDFFDRYGAGKAFLADGYAVAARAALERRQPLRALKLGGHAFLLQPRRPTLWLELRRRTSRSHVS